MTLENGLVECYESYGSQTVNADDKKTTVETQWKIDGTYDSNVARSALRDASSPIYLDALNNRLCLRSDHEVKELGCGMWTGTVHYESGEASNDGPTFDFNTTGGTAHITQSFGTRKYGTSPPDFKGAIGVRDKQVDGVDIIIPALRFSETWKIPASLITTGYVNNLAALTGQTNAAPWRNYPTEAVLFMGAEGQSASDSSLVPVKFSFDVGVNAENMTVGGIGGITKKAWEYIWAYYEDTEDTDAKKVLKKPKWIFVERVYGVSSFSGLGI